MNDTKAANRKGKMMATRRCIIEAMDDTHEWDSDYVGSESYTVEAAQAYVYELEERAANDPANEDGCSDGVSWNGWVFRILADDADGCYCVPVQCRSTERAR